MAVDRIKKFFFPTEEEEVFTNVNQMEPKVELKNLRDEESFSFQSTPERQTYPSNPTPQYSNSSLNNTVVFNPTRYEEAEKIAQDMVSGHSVIVNLEDLMLQEEMKNQAVRIIDFLCGVAFSLRLEIKRINATTFLFAPSNVVQYDGK